MLHNFNTEQILNMMSKMTQKVQEATKSLSSVLSAANRHTASAQDHGDHSTLLYRVDHINVIIIALISVCSPKSYQHPLPQDARERSSPYCSPHSYPEAAMQTKIQHRLSSRCAENEVGNRAEGRREGTARRAATVSTLSGLDLKSRHI